MKRWLPLLALWLVVSGCGSSGRVVSSPIVRLIPPSPTALRFTAASNRAYAQRDARKLLETVALPASAKHVRVAPKAAPGWFRQRARGLPHASGITEAVGIWTVPEPLARVQRFVHAHEHAQPRKGYPSFGQSNAVFCCLHRGAVYVYPVPDEWAFPGVPGRSSSRSVYL